MKKGSRSRPTGKWKRERERETGKCDENKSNRTAIRPRLLCEKQPYLHNYERWGEGWARKIVLSLRFGAFAFHKYTFILIISIHLLYLALLDVACCCMKLHKPRQVSSK